MPKVTYSNFPDLNDTIEVKKVKLSSSPHQDPFDGLSEMLMDMLGSILEAFSQTPQTGGPTEEEIEGFKNILKKEGIDPDDPNPDINKIKEFARKLNSGELDEALIENGLKEPPTVGVLPGMDFLSPEDFGAIKYVRRSDLFEYFKSKYGTTPKRYISSIDGVQQFHYDQYTEDSIYLDDVADLKYVYDDDKIIVFHTRMKDRTQLGFYIAFFLSADTNEFEGIIPTFGNTFKVDTESNSVNLLSLEADEDDINSPRIQNSFSMVLFGLRWILYQKATNRIIVSPHDFGKITSNAEALPTPTEYLKIGKIAIDEENPKALLLARDAGLEEADGSYPIYLKFEEPKDPSSLSKLAAKLNQVDWNEVPFLDDVELKYTSTGKLYFNIDLGKF